MRGIQKVFLAFFLVCLGIPSVNAALRELPVPTTISSELQKIVGSEPFPFWNTHPKNANEWRVFAEMSAKGGAEGLTELQKKLDVSVTQETLASVPVFIITPSTLRSENANRVCCIFMGVGMCFTLV